MKIAERLELAEALISENPNSLAISVPTHTLKVLLEYCRDRESLKKECIKERTRANEYAVKYHSAKANYERLKELL